MESTAQANLPLTETTLYILLSLAPAPRHGYAIMKAVEELSAGRVLLSTGTLYGALKRLLAGGWIERVTEAGCTNGRQCKAYTLTHAGRKVLEAEVERLQELAAVARRQMIGATG